MLSGCTIQNHVVNVRLPGSGGIKPVYFSECGGRRAGMGQGKVGATEVVESLVKETHKWSLNQPLKGDGHPPIQGSKAKVGAGSRYMGGVPNQRALQHQQTYLPGGYQLIAGCADGRQVSNMKKTTMVALWFPSTGAGGGQVGGCLWQRAWSRWWFVQALCLRAPMLGGFAPPPPPNTQSLRTVCPIAELAMGETTGALRHVLKRCGVPEALQEVQAVRLAQDVLGGSLAEGR